MTKFKLKYKEWLLEVSHIVLAQQKEKCERLQKEINQIHQQMILKAKLKNTNKA